MAPGKSRSGGGQRIKAARSGSTIQKPAGLKPQKGIKLTRNRGKSAATSRLRPGELMNANAFPRNAIAKSALTSRPHGYTTDKRKNLAVAARQARKAGLAVGFVNKGEMGYVASYQKWGEGKPRGAKGIIHINKDAKMWSNPAAEMKDARKWRMYSTSNPYGIIAHEVGHARHARTGKFGASVQEFHTIAGNKARRQEARANRVSLYAGTSPAEFVAEVRAGRATGRRYSTDIMKSYREWAGLSLKPAARRRSRLKKR